MNHFIMVHTTVTYHFIMVRTTVTSQCYLANHADPTAKRRFVVHPKKVWLITQKAKTSMHCQCIHRPLTTLIKTTLFWLILLEEEFTPLLHCQCTPVFLNTKKKKKKLKLMFKFSLLSAFDNHRFKWLNFQNPLKWGHWEEAIEVQLLKSK